MRRGEIWMVDLPDVDGREQAGRRPGVVVQDEVVGADSPLVIIVPLSSQLGARRFPACATVEPSGENGLTFRSVALGFQVRAADRSRFLKRLGTLQPDDLDRVVQGLRTLIAL